MLVNAVANLANVLRMNRKHGAYVTDLHKTRGISRLCLISASLCQMSLCVLIVHIRPEF